VSYSIQIQKHQKGNLQILNNDNKKRCAESSDHSTNHAGDWTLWHNATIIFTRMAMHTDEEGT